MIPGDARAAVYAGIAAGIAAGAVQIVLWSIFTDAMPAILYRDSRFAAAIVHFALAIVYAWLLACLIADLRMPMSLLVGAAFGLCVYALNMYGFTAVFPWFASSRDWITAGTHLVFE